MKHTAWFAGVLLMFLLLASVLPGVPISGMQARGMQTEPAGDRLLQPSTVDDAARARVQATLERLPLYFIENRGQADEQVDFYVKGSDKTIYFTPQDLTFILTAPRTDEAADDPVRPSQPGPRAPQPAARWIVKVDFVDANPDVHPVGEEQTDAVFSYFKGSPDQWRTGVPTYRRIVYRDLWPGIDLAFYGTVDRLKYEFLVRPGADPGRIHLAYRGAEVTQAADGSLEVATPLGGFSDDAPVAYQEMDGRRVDVAVAYAIRKTPPAPSGAARSGELQRTVYAFELGDYDPTRPLVLDPAILVYCGYIGGADGDGGVGIAVDGAGNAYVVGATESSESVGFPVTVAWASPWTGRGTPTSWAQPSLPKAWASR